MVEVAAEIAPARELAQLPVARRDYLYVDCDLAFAAEWRDLDGRRTLAFTVNDNDVGMYLYVKGEVVYVVVLRGSGVDVEDLLLSSVLAELP